MAADGLVTNEKLLGASWSLYFVEKSLHFLESYRSIGQPKSIIGNEL